MRNNFLKKPYLERGGEAIPRPFFLKKIEIERISGLTV